MSSHNPKVLAVIGPTATGKTVIGAHLANALHSEVISCDSQLVYQELAIGVARPTPEEMQGVPHHMIGVVPPTMEFSAGDYASLARPILDRLLSERKTPVLVGGTGFYLRALLQPKHLPQVPTNPALRQRLKERLQAEGPDALYAELQRKDPERAAELHPHDTVRVIRALEIIDALGGPVPKTPQELAYPTQAIGLTYANRELHVRKIRERLETMMAQGFLEEVRTLYDKYGFCPALQRAHGYPELVEVLQGKRTVASALDQIEINIRQYSKRQMTWFRRFPGIRWYPVEERTVNEIVTDVLKTIDFV